MNSTSNRKLNISINGRSYLVEVGSLHTSPITVNVNGQAYQVELGDVELESTPTPGLTGGDIKSPPPPSGSAPTIAKPESKGGAGREANNTVTAPMPGNIIDIAVKPGEQVSSGQALCALEAMKMKNTIRSPQAGVIATIEVTEGQVVGHDDVLFTFV